MKFKNMQSLIFIVLIHVILLSNLEIKAQTIRAKNVRYIPEVEVIFSKGVNEYRQKLYTEANRTFEELINLYPVHQRITATYFMLGKCYYKLGAYKKAVSQLSELLQNYPHSNYVDDTQYLIGYCYYEMDDYINSLKQFLLVADTGKEKRLVEKSRNIAIRIIDNNITINRLEQILKSETSEIPSAILTIKLSQRYLERGERDNAISLLQSFLQQHPDNPYNTNITELLKRTNIPTKWVQKKIGIILPLSGEYAEQAIGVLAGIQYAQKKFNDTSSVKLELVVKDSESDIVKLVKSAQELSRDDKVLSIIGDLDRDNTVVISAVINNTNIPLISPTTSGNNVTSLQENIFQLNCDVENRGQALARYAMEACSLKTFATLAPADQYGKNMTDSFTSTVDLLGGKIIAQKWYYADAQDLKRQFQSIRDLGFNLMDKDSLVDEYTKDLSDLQKRRFKDEVIPVSSIDGVFFPCYTEDIPYIAPQFAFVNVRAQIFGGENWYDEDMLRKNRKYLEGLIFCSGYYFDETNPEFIKFRNDFRRVMKRTPEIMECYGYDAMSVLIEAVSKNNLSREDVGDYMRTLKNFKGIRGPITINKNRVNSDIRILNYLNGRIVPLR